MITTLGGGISSPSGGVFDVDLQNASAKQSEVCGTLDAAQAKGNRGHAIGFRANLGSQNGDVVENASVPLKAVMGLGTDFDLDGGLVAGGDAGVTPLMAAGCCGSNGAGIGTQQDAESGMLVAQLGVVNIEHGLAAHGSMELRSVAEEVGRAEYKGHTALVATEPLAFVQPVPLRASGAATAHGAGVGEAGDPSLTLDCDGSAGVAMAEPMVFDPMQVTHPENRSQPAPGSHANAGAPPVAFQPGNLTRKAGAGPSSNIFPTLRSDHGRGASDQQPHVQIAMTVRRLTPVECARLQGFPDDYLDILYRGKPAADGPKYKALGNSWAIPVVRWVGFRIQRMIFNGRD